SDDQQLWHQAWVVWLNIGRCCTKCPPEKVIVIDRYDSNIPSQNFLTYYIDIFPNIIQHIWSTEFLYNQKDFEQFSSIVEHILAVPIHSDMALFLIPTDVNLTVLQESAFKAMDFVRKNLKESSSHTTQSPLLPLLFQRLLVLSSYAINPPIFDCTDGNNNKKLITTKQQQSNTQQNNNLLLKSSGGDHSNNISFVPFSEKILRMTVGLYEDVGTHPSVIESGTLQTIIQTLQVPLSMKYNCPSPSTWKLAIECFFRVLKVGLVVARKYRYLAPADSAIDEIQRDELIDCQVIELIRDDILPYANVLTETFLTKILNILNRGSIYSYATDNFIDIDSSRRLREEFSKVCFETLLKYSFINETSSSFSSTNDGMLITKLALSSMLNRCKEIMQKYAHDERLHGKCPLPRPRTAEMISVLKALGTLITALKKAPKNSVELTIWHQLIDLYPCLVECTTSPAQQICTAVKETLHHYFALLAPPSSSR
ncbi:unnamed protein product, partial [Didymodactylos carnosus]